jgi:alpha-galactosidase
LDLEDVGIEPLVSELGIDVHFEKTMNREDALRDADFVINTATITHNEYFMKRRRELTAEYGYFYAHTGFPEYHNLQLMLDVAKDDEMIADVPWSPMSSNTRVPAGNQLK